jgi:steroid 5-alpha reductase family enzyme
MKSTGDLGTSADRPGGRAWRDNKALSVGITAVVYAGALVLAVILVGLSGISAPLAQIALGTLVATIVVFAISVAVDNSSMYDPYWSLQPLAIAGFYLWSDRGAIDARQVLVTALVLLYAVRLTSNFYRDWPGLRKEDFRYVGFRRRSGRFYWPVSFFGIHLFPTIMVFLGCLPLYAVAGPSADAFRWLDIVAALITLAAVGIAFVADEQLRVFRRDPANRGRCIRTGLWARSRHPNYLGEIMTWWGLWLFALAAGPRWWWTVVGAVAITLMFVFVSVPMMEKRALATREGYRRYRDETPMLLPGWRTRAKAVDGADSTG